MNDSIDNDLPTPQVADKSDGMADAIAAVALIAIFVATCIFWISGQ